MKSETEWLANLRGILQGSSAALAMGAEAVEKTGAEVLGDERQEIIGEAITDAIHCVLRAIQKLEKPVPSGEVVRA